MDELLEQFVVEGRELLQQASDDLLALERRPGDRALLDRMFRCVHTLKGSAAIFAFAPMVEALHAAEDAFDAARRDGAAPSRAVIDAMLDLIGRCDEWVGAVASTGALPPGVDAVSARLVAALAGTATSPGAMLDGGEGPPAWAAALRDGEPEIAAALAQGVAVTALRYVPVPDCFFLGDDPLALLAAVPGLIALRLVTGATSHDIDPFRCSLSATAASTASPSELKVVFRLHADQVEFVDLAAEPPAEPVGEAAARPTLAAGGRAGSLRVAAPRLDELIEGLGELLATKHGLADLLRRCAVSDPALAEPVAKASALLDRQVAEAHHRAMRLRLVPLARVFGRLPRLVRETATTLGKSIELTISGEAIEIDGTVADGLFEPLLHLLRNAVDHGVESPDRRRASGKPVTGRVRLEAEQVAQGIAVTVSDDGGGIDPARVRGAAIRRGLLDASAAAAFDDVATLELLFAPGFSTAEEVSGVSGRGVGLDAVRDGIAALGGTISLDGGQGRGSRFKLLLPQRAAITPVMLVHAGGSRWGIPADTVEEVLRLKSLAISEVHQGRALVHRGRTLAVLDLADLVGSSDEDVGAGDPRLLVVRIGDEEVGLAVAEVEGREDVLLRPCIGLLAASRALRGTAVLGDGAVLMVLDLAALEASRRAGRRHDR